MSPFTAAERVITSKTASAFLPRPALSGYRPGEGLFKRGLNALACPSKFVFALLLSLFLLQLPLRSLATEVPDYSAWSNHPLKHTRFDPCQDTFAFYNQLKWIYPGFEQPPLPYEKHSRVKMFYTWHCFVMSRAANQFFRFARFDPSAPKLSESGYAKQIRRVASIPPWREPRLDTARIVIPGYSNLVQFSTEHPDVIRNNLGGVVLPLARPGMWRIAYGASRAHQQRMARQLCAQLDKGLPCQILMSNHPGMQLNHSVLIVDYQDGEDGIRFTAYDPNFPQRPLDILFTHSLRQFSVASLGYFAGGKINVFWLYHRPLL